MVDFTRMKKTTLGAPPPPHVTGGNLNAPEVAPLEKHEGRRDGRTMRKSNRTVTFATKVTEAFDTQVRDIAEEEGIMLVEVLERALEAYLKSR